jgi:peptidoglycan/xylan/chitin deacetylase (PgdA/CDA1 family)
VKVNTLMYHDVVRGGEVDSSGFSGAGPARYKVEWPRFVEHLDAIAAAVSQPPILPEQFERAGLAKAWSITFDDGGASAEEVGAELNRRNWRGAFLVTTERVGRRAFLDADGIRALHAAGHVVGSHSHTHPARLSACSIEQIAEEWRRSTEILGGIIGEPVQTASVPGGYLSDAVARAAAHAGILVLFTSEPVRKLDPAEGCVLVGRFAITRDASKETVAAAAAARATPWVRQRASWTLRKGAKRIGGDAYVRARARLLARRAGG